MCSHNGCRIRIGPLEDSRVTVSIGNDTLTVTSARISSVMPEHVASTKRLVPSQARRVRSKAPTRLSATRNVPLSACECIAVCIVLLICFIMVITFITGVTFCLSALVNRAASHYYGYSHIAEFITPFGAFSVMCVTIIAMRAASYMCK